MEPLILDHGIEKLKQLWDTAIAQQKEGTIISASAATSTNASTRVSTATPPQPDLLQALLDCADPQSNAKLSRNELHTESLLLLIGGIDPTAYSLTWTLHLLLLHSHCLEKAQREIQSTFPEHPQTLAFAEIRNALLYL
ncbi:hypothetical protein LPJ66_005422 [Kickxella alabastrina]|uniref:Uncharacterized protein n=1 Tax=Kickxella alabastrina TaxID=61397 RepID=A0ACC1IFA1_9FUNG|nr:hypothetical protein LPJ66_005422 [Kickxella alabastrina]